MENKLRESKIRVISDVEVNTQHFSQHAFIHIENLVTQGKNFKTN